MTLYSVLFTSISIGWLLPPVAHADNSAPIKVTAVEFTSTPAPSNVMEMTTPYTRSQAVVTLADGSNAMSTCPASTGFGFRATARSRRG